MTGDDFSIALNFASRNGYQIITLHEFLAPTCACLLDLGDRSQHEWDLLRIRAHIIKQEHDMPDSFWVFFDPYNDSEGFLLIGPTPDWLVGSTTAYWSGVTDGDFFTARRHVECAEAEVDYNHHIVNVMYKDEWCFLHEIDNPDDLEWLLGAHAVAADRIDAPERVMRYRLEYGV